MGRSNKHLSSADYIVIYANHGAFIRRRKRLKIKSKTTTLKRQWNLYNVSQKQICSRGGSRGKYSAGHKRGVSVGVSHLDPEELLSPVRQEWEGRESTQWGALLGLSSTKSCCCPRWVCVCQKYQGCWNSRSYKGMLLCPLNYLDYIRTQVRGHNFIIHL